MKIETNKPRRPRTPPAANNDRVCQDCGTSLAGTFAKKRCKPCAAAYIAGPARELKNERYRARYHARNSAFASGGGKVTDMAARAEALLAEYGSSTAKPLEYAGQELAAGGYYLIRDAPSSGKQVRLKRVCADCGRDDADGVFGKWGPVFEDRERGLVLLCWDCYEGECDVEMRRDQQDRVA